MDESKLLTDLIVELRNELPGVGIGAYKRSKGTTQLYLRLPRSLRFTPTRTKIAKDIAKRHKGLGKVTIFVSRPASAKGWVSVTEDFFLRPWSIHKVEIEKLKVDLKKFLADGDLDIAVYLCLDLAKQYLKDSELDLTQRCLTEVTGWLSKLDDLDEEKKNNQDSVALFHMGTGRYKEAEAAWKEADPNPDHGLHERMIRTLKYRKQRAQAEEKELSKIFKTYKG